ncbi:MAG: sec-independent protein translocase protein TatA [Candidatus Tokpelaia sp. JSC085]|nr:MAG: sec-independent protein translocase protein TatA [Candidatus Tokpelaia sp. JSC085]
MFSTGLPVIVCLMCFLVKSSGLGDEYMNLFAPQHLIPILVLLFFLFGRGKISEFMGDCAKGIKSFKKGLQDDDVVEKEKEESISAAPREMGTHDTIRCYTNGTVK